MRARRKSHVVPARNNSEMVCVDPLMNTRADSDDETTQA